MADIATVSPFEPELFGAVIGRIHINSADIFDVEERSENRSLFRLANRLHMKTRDRVVESLLLFKSGDRYSVRLLQESERMLRGRDYFYDAEIKPTRYDRASNEVDVEVRTRDVWTLSPELSLTRNGGESEFSLGLSDSNVFGTGKGVKIERKTGIDRDETELRYTDPNVAGSRFRFEILHSDNSDGFRQSFDAERPFFALDARWSGRFRAFDRDRLDPIYDLGEIVEEFRHEETTFDLHGGWSRGLRGAWARRWLAGVSYERDRFSTAARSSGRGLPEDRVLAYPWIGFELIQDDFRIASDRDRIGRTEDVSFGARWFFQLGYSAEVFGGDRRAVIVRTAIEKGWETSPGRTLLVAATVEGRREREEVRNLMAATRLRYHHRNFGRHLFFVGVDAAATKALDAEDQVLLGGDNGLRGYPLRYQTGEHRAVLTVEQRLYSDWYPFRLFRVGGAAFVDVGRTWGVDPRGTPSQGLLRNVGLGLRLGSTRSSAGSVIHVDLAFPLDGDDSIDRVQLVVDTKSSF